MQTLTHQNTLPHCQENSLNYAYIQSVKEALESYLINMFKDFSSLIQAKLAKQRSYIDAKEEKIRQQIESYNESLSSSRFSIQSAVEFQEETFECVDLEKIELVIKKMQLSINELYLNDLIDGDDSQRKDRKQANKLTNRKICSEQVIGRQEERNDQEDSSEQPQDDELQGNAEAEKAQNNINQSKKIKTLNEKIKVLKKDDNSNNANPTLQSSKNNLIFLKHSCNKRTNTSLLNNLSNRKYKVQSLSCPKNEGMFQCESKLQRDSEILREDSKLKQSRTVLKQSNNKMPLISKTKNIIEELISYIQDEYDANLVRFHLKKTLKSIESLDGVKAQCKNQKKVDKSTLYSANNAKISSSSSKLIPKYVKLQPNLKAASKLNFQLNLTPEYFGVSGLTMCEIEKFKSKGSRKVKPSQSQKQLSVEQECSIFDFLPLQSEIKEEFANRHQYSNLYSCRIADRNLTTKMKPHGSEYVSEESGSKKNREAEYKSQGKHFQRTNIENKLNMKKKKSITLQNA